MQISTSPLEESSTLNPVHPFHILEKNSVATFFEPLISVHKMGVIGLEAISQSVDPEQGGLMETGDLLNLIPKEDSASKLRLDHLTRQKGLEDFSSHRSRRPNLILFLSVNPSILQEGVIGSGFLLQQAQSLQLEPRQIVVQISLAVKMNELLVRKFMEYQRLHGFLTALKNVTTSSSHLDALHRFQPDMVQASDSLVKGISSSFERQTAFRRMARTAHSLGVLVAAGGIQSEEDGLVCLESGADLLQGKYLSKSYENNLIFTLSRKARLGFLSSRYRRRITNRAKRGKDLMNQCKWTADSIFARLEKTPTLDPQRFSTVFQDHPSLECIYLLDEEGTQVSDVVCSEYHIPERKKLLFKPSPKGTDHSLREYYYALARGAGSHFTEPYLSMNSGNLCVTAAQKLINPSGDALVLCLDLNVSKF